MSELKTMAGPGVPVNPISETEEIIRRLLEKVKSLPNGTETTTALLLNQIEDENLAENLDMIQIEFELTKAARKEGIILDKSKYNDMCVGIPCNIPFVIKRKKR